jgi:hypothetical protein
MHSLADIACFRKWATVWFCVAKADAWQVFAVYNFAVATETTPTTDNLLQQPSHTTCRSIRGSKAEKLESQAKQ